MRTAVGLVRSRIPSHGHHAVRYRDLTDRLTVSVTSSGRQTGHQRSLTTGRFATRKLGVPWPFALVDASRCFNAEEGVIDIAQGGDFDLPSSLRTRSRVFTGATQWKP